MRMAMYPYGHLSMYKWQCIHMQNLVMHYLHVATLFVWMWLCIHMRMSMNLCACGHITTRSCIYVHEAVSPHVEFGHALCAIAQNFGSTWAHFPELWAMC
jgi:hypothetical protein